MVLNKFEMEVFIVQKGLWNLAKEKIMRERVLSGPVGLPDEPPCHKTKKECERQALLS